MLKGTLQVCMVQLHSVFDSSSLLYVDLTEVDPFCLFFSEGRRLDDKCLVVVVVVVAVVMAAL